MRRRLTLIAGSGALVPLVAGAARRAGDVLQVIDVVGRGDVAGDVTEAIPLREAGRLLGAVKAFRTTHMMLAGAVHISDAEREGLVRAMGPAGRIGGSLGDLGFAGAILLYCRLNRIRLVGVHDVSPELLAQEGMIAGPTLDAEGIEFARLALRGARAIGGIDLGQAIVFAGTRPVAAEDAGGTDALLERVAALRAAGLVGNGAGRLVLAKALKPRQPTFADLPTIGPETVRKAAAAGISVIVVEARRCLVLERVELTAEAAARQLSVVGLRAGHG